MYISDNPFMAGNISPGVLLGTTGSSGLIASINESLGGSSFFKEVRDKFTEIRDSFIQKAVLPLQIGAQAVIRTVNILVNPDVIRPLVEEADFKAVPPCMYEPIIMFPPLKNLFIEGRVSGFGFNQEDLPDEDVWGRLISNGTCEDVLAAAGPDGKVMLEWEFCSTDPKVSIEELDAVENTRHAILKMLNTTRYDPTDYPEERG